MTDHPTYEQLQQKVLDLEDQLKVTRENESKFRALVEDIDAIIFSLDQAGNIAYISPAVQSLTGFSPQEVYNQNFSRFIYPDDLAKLAEAFGDVKAGRLKSDEYRLLTKDGRVVWAKSFSRPVTDKAQVLGIRGVLIDITQRRRDEEELRNQKKRLESLINHSSLAVATLDASHEIVACNRAFEELFQYSASEVLGRNLDDVIANGEVMKDALDNTQRIMSGQAIHGSGPRQRKDGAMVEVQFLGVPVVLDGKIVGVYAIYWDISELKRAQLALKEKEILYQTLVETSTDAIFTLKNQYFIDCNPRATIMLDCPKDQIIGQTPIYFSPPRQPDGRDSAEKAREKIQAALDGKPQVFEWQHQTLSGLSIEVEVSLNRMDIPGGPFLQAICRDISLRKQAEHALKESEERYRTIIESSGDAYFEVDLEGNFIAFNEALCKILGYNEQELKGMHYRQSPQPGEAIQKAYHTFLNVFRTGESAKAQEWSIRHKDGTEMKVEVSVYLKKDLHGRPIGFRGLVRDITVRKWVEQALRESQENYKQLYDNAVVGMFRTDFRTGQLLEINDSCARLFGYQSREEALSQAVLAEHYVTREAGRNIVEAMKKQGRVEGRIEEFRRRDGSTFWAEFTARIYPEAGYIEGAAIDVTDRLNIEQALRRSEKRYRQLFNSISDFILTHDFQGMITDVNPSVLQASGYSREELIGQSFSFFMPPDYRALFHNQYLPHVITQGKADGIFTFLAKDGQHHYIEFRSTVQPADAGTPYVACAGRDVTERIMAQRELRRMEEQLSHAQKMEAVGTLASGISHDFNNFLQAVSGCVQLMLARKDQDQENKRCLMEMDSAIERASELVQRLLTFSRKVKPELKPINLNEQINLTITLLQRTIPKMIDIETRLATDLKMIDGDPGQLEQVLMNLGTNARDAMPDGGRLVIETENFRLEEEKSLAHIGLSPGEYILWRVSDTGRGMDQETLGHIFEPFYTTKGIGEGTGLGLSTVYGIVKDHGGAITCYSELGRGTTFHIYLPARMTDSLDLSSPAQAPDIIVGGHENILVVDDEKTITDVVVSILESYGYTAMMAESGEKALEVYQSLSSPPDLVLLDLGMPGMGGLACLKEILKINPGAKVIIASGYSATGQAKSALEGGAREFVSKPYRLKDMMRKIRKVLDES